MGTNGEKETESRTNIESHPQGSTAVWEQLLRLAESGDIRAIKLYYDMLEKKQRPASSGGGAAEDMEPMAAIRRAVFGDAAVDAAAVCAAVPSAAAEKEHDLPDADEDW